MPVDRSVGGRESPWMQDNRTTFIYEDAGRLSHKVYDDGKRLSYEYEPMSGRLSTMTDAKQQTTRYRYFADDALASARYEDANAAWTTTDDRTLIWDGYDLKSERSTGSGTELVHHWPQGFQTLNAQQTAVNSYYYHRDHLGSVRDITNANGEVQARYAYDAWGKQRRIPIDASGLMGSVEAPMGFTGHYRHSASGLHLAFYRAYDAELGRWLNRDPIGEEGGLNLYGYCFNRPVTLFDPEGTHVWVEGASGDASPHKSIAVGDPNGDYGTFSYAYNDGGTVYEDEELGGPLERYAETTPEQDAAILANLEAGESEQRRGKHYGLFNTCRDYSQDKFEEFKARHGLTESKPPKRAVKPVSKKQKRKEASVSLLSTAAAGGVTTTVSR